VGGRGDGPFDRTAASVAASSRTLGIGGETSLVRRACAPSRGSGGGASRRCAAGPGEIAASSERLSAAVGSSRGGAEATTSGTAMVCAAAGSGGGTVVPDLRCGSGAAGRGGNCTPVGGALRARRGGNGGSRRPHAAHAA
jgi:hypothetical protein